MTTKVIIDSIIQSTPSIKIFNLKSADGNLLPQFSAGAHIDVKVTEGIKRCYSLCSDPNDNNYYKIAVKLEESSTGGSIGMHQKMEHDILEISNPRNNFPLVDNVSRFILFAAGVGITPIISMIYELSRGNRDFHLHYFSKTPEDAAFLDLLSDKRFFNAVSLHFEDDNTVINNKIQEILYTERDDSHIYMCGPRKFMDLIKDKSSTKWKKDFIHFENFAPDLDGFSENSFEFSVKLAKSDKEFLIPEDKTIIQVLADNDIFIDTSCEQGVCGTCMVTVIDGIPDHRDEILSEDERNSCSKIIPCVSRSKSKTLVLDL